MQNYNLKNIDGTTIKNGDINLLSVFDDKPVLNDVIVFGGNKYTVMNVNPVCPDGETVIYYDIQAR